MKVIIRLSGEGGCSTIKECTKEEYEFLRDIENTMGDVEDDAYAPSIDIRIYEE